MSNNRSSSNMNLQGNSTLKTSLWEEQFQKFCQSEKYSVSIRPIQYATQWQISNGQNTIQVNSYNNGTILLQGSDSPLKKSLAKFCFGDENISSNKPKKFEGNDSSTVKENFPEIDPPEIVLPTGKRIGMDEVGKGDYFGPLVTSAAYIDENTEILIKKMGVCDSKQITDPKIVELAKKLIDKIPHHTQILMPEYYNLRYEEEQNLNYLLASCHAETLKKLLDKQPCEVAIADQFARDKELLLNKVKKNNCNIQLIQVIHGERDLAVAMASVFARAAFLDRIAKMSSTYRMQFPKGSSDVQYAIKEFIKTYSKKELYKVAKLHFNMRMIS